MQSKNILVQLVLLSFVFVAAHALVVPDTENTQSAEFVKFADNTADMEAIDDTEEAEEAEEAEDTEDVEDTENIEDMETMEAGVNARADDEKTKQREALAKALRHEIPDGLLLESGKPEIAFRNAKGKISRGCTAKCKNYWMRRVLYLFQNDGIKSPKGCNCNCLASRKCK